MTARAPKYMSAGEVYEGLDKLEGEAHLCAMVQWRAGLRISEALALRRLDVDLTRNMLTVVAGKNGKTRTVPIHKELAQAFRSVKRPPRSGRYFKGHRSTMFRRYAAAGIKGTHSLRHSFSRHLMAEGIALNTIQLWLGHSHLRTTTDTYLPLVAADPAQMDRVA